MTLHPQTKSAAALQPVTGWLSPISLRTEQGQALAPLLNGQPITFETISLEALTRFFAVELTAQIEDQQAAIRFVLNLPVDGMPEARDKRILHSLISDRSRFIRYLLFLLAQEADPYAFKQLLKQAESTNGSGSSAGLAGLPLIEELVRAVSRQPEKIDHIDRLVEDLKQTVEGAALLPEDFDMVWRAFRTWREERS
jgi:hypothetical protein